VHTAHGARRSALGKAGKVVAQWPPHATPASDRGMSSGPAAASNAARRPAAEWSTVPGDPEATRQLLSRRVGYFAKVFFLLSAAFYVRSALAIALVEHAWPPLTAAPFVLHLAALGVHAASWWLCRSGKRGTTQLRALDAFGLLGAMALYGALTIAEASSFEHAVAVQSAGAEVFLVALIMVGITLTHATIVPLDVRWMLGLSTATCVVGVASAYLVSVVGLPAELLADKPWLPLNQAIFVSVWALLAVTVSSIAARIVHGLQQRVRDANEIGQYVLEERIGEGGMGVVYLARHALLRRPTAVKLLPSDRAGERAVRRFEREVRLTSGLTHPNTIAIFDFGRTPDGVFYYAMEYLDGITLEDLVALTGPQPAARVIQILRQACGSLGEAHHCGLIHRDIKPANLMLCVRGGVPDQVKVLDFGLVKEYSAEVEAGLSLDGALLGTPAYIAPESIVDPERVDGRADLYGLGAIGYFLLVGEPVFESHSLLEACVQHVHSAPVPPSERTAAPIPPALEALIMRCLAKDPAARPASALDLGHSLEALGALAGWSRADADLWWQQRAPELVRAARAQRVRSATPGPRTVAVDLDHRGSD
jgi:eukaryotic-like serine/threonine-protein kinase